MTQEELDSMLDANENNTSKGENSQGGEENLEMAPEPIEEHKVVHQLDDVTKDSEAKAGEIFDKLEEIGNKSSDVITASKALETVLQSQQVLLQKLHDSFPQFNAFSSALEQIKTAQFSLKTIKESAQAVDDASVEAMDIMQYQDINRQKIERVINVMRALSRYMNSLFDSRGIDDSKRVASATHIAGDSTEDVMNDDDIEALIASLGGGK